MVWCGYCAENRQSNNVDGKICCSFCGRVLDEDNFSSEPTFVKNAAGQSQLSGNFVRTVKSDYSASRERTLNEAYNDIESMAYALGIDGGDSIARPALAFYTLRGISQGGVGKSKLRLRVFTLHAGLFGGRKPNISRTALHIVASMKRDWMQTGRKPSGVCGAALYISALSYGLSCSKSEIIKVVRICEATLTKRLIEFENTESGSLTIDEFNTRAEELEKEERLSVQLYSGSKGSGITEVLCEHKKSVELPFAHGLCESCYTDFVKLSGGLDGGSEPPAFQRAERERLMAKEAAEENAEDPNIPMSNQVENNGGEYLEAEKGGNTLSVNGSKYLQISGSEIIGALSGAKTDDNATPDTLHGLDGMGPDDHDESENFSDIDDAEVDGYLHNEEERRFKEIIWVKMNREYLEEQAAKQAAELAAKNDKEFNLANCSEDVQAAQELAAAAAAAVAKSRKEKQQKRAAELKNSGPAQTAAEATKQMLTRKRLSSKINYDVLEKLFDESAKLENTKKSRNVDDNMVKSSKIDPEVDDTYEEAFGEDVQYDEDVGGYDYDQRDDDDEY
ncbi:uncharacterized protein LOC107770534 isoform X2 [Nicotiana tabacum]|uniref:Uncharacterized protein LOC107770534 isoform X2 n=1 Tax=Nicotiana tabacum TaxID=4097 RepID=A0AC58TCF1_TOBAC